MDERLKKQLAFALEIDKEKNIDICLSLYFLIEFPQKQPVLGSLWNAYSSLTTRSMSEKRIFYVPKCFFSG